MLSTAESIRELTLYLDRREGFPQSARELGHKCGLDKIYSKFSAIKLLLFISLFILFIVEVWPHCDSWTDLRVQFLYKQYFAPQKLEHFFIK